MIAMKNFETDTALRSSLKQISQAYLTNMHLRIHLACNANHSMLQTASGLEESSVEEGGGRREENRLVLVCLFR